MAIEQRGNNSYYYRGKRVGGRVVKEYVGKDEWTDILFQLERLEADRDRCNRAMLRWEIQKKQEQLDTFCRDALALSDLFLMAAGYHQHERGQMRKQRMRKNTELVATKKTRR